MIEVSAAVQFCSNKTFLLRKCNSSINRRHMVFKPNQKCGVAAVGWGGTPTIKSAVMSKAQTNDISTFSSKIDTDIPLYEAPWASFDQYLEDKPRVFEAMFPEKLRSQQVSEDVWMVHMVPIDFLFLTVRPVINMRLRCQSESKRYPPGVPQEITKVLELEIIKWELEGLDEMLKPSHFSLGVKGALYPDRRGTSSLKGTLQMSIGFILPAVLSLIPGDVLRNVAESVLGRLTENMKDRVNHSLLADYETFKSEKSLKSA